MVDMHRPLQLHLRSAVTEKWQVNFPAFESPVLTDTRCTECTILWGTILTKVRLRYTAISYLPHAALAGAREGNRVKLMVRHNRRLLYYTRCLYGLTFPRSASSAAGTLQVGEDATRSIVVLFTIAQYCIVVSQIDKCCPILPRADENRFITNIRIYCHRPTLPNVA